MNITIFGATRGTGRHFLRLALAEGHAVTAAARRPDAVAERHPRLTVVRGDVLDPASLEVKGADAVVFLAGPANPLRSELYTRGMPNVMDAMAAQGVSRFVGVTNALGTAPSDTVLQRLSKLLVGGTALRGVNKDARRAEAAIRGRDLDWTIVQPPRLTDKPAKGVYRTAREDCVRGGLTISREDLAHAVLAAIPDSSTFRACVGVAY
jgi:putative NADH-flavin reductase